MDMAKTFGPAETVVLIPGPSRLILGYADMKENKFQICDQLCTG
jgi:hypothetical protein